MVNWNLHAQLRQQGTENTNYATPRRPPSHGKLCYSAAVTPHTPPTIQQSDTTRSGPLAVTTTKHKKAHRPRHIHHWTPLHRLEETPQTRASPHLPTYSMSRIHFMLSPSEWWLMSACLLGPPSNNQVVVACWLLIIEPARMAVAGITSQWCCSHHPSMMYHTEVALARLSKSSTSLVVPYCHCRKCRMPHWQLPSNANCHGPLQAVILTNMWQPGPPPQLRSSPHELNNHMSSFHPTPSPSQWNRHHTWWPLAWLPEMPSRLYRDDASK